MRVVIPQIVWHSRDPVLTVDCDPSCKGENGFYRMASGGGDAELNVWRVTGADTLTPDVKIVAQLKRHEKPINIVRFSPDGRHIATGGDDAYVIIWRSDRKTQTEEFWTFEKSLRKHIEDVSDLSWSPDSNFLVSGSVDNTAVLWDVRKGAALHVWSEHEHKGFVHGVSYDPLHEAVATTCIDRNLRFFNIKTGKLATKALKYPDPWVTSEVQESLVELDEKENLKKISKEDSTVKKRKASSGMVNRLFQDDSLPTFCRRLSFSPKGELLMVPGGMLPPSESLIDAKNKIAAQKQEMKEKKGKKKGPAAKPVLNNNAVVLFCRHSWTNPCALIPTGTSYSVTSRFCPVYFEADRKTYAYEPNYANPVKKSEREISCVGKLIPPKRAKESLMKMPYRLVYAIATNDTIIIGDTASVQPLAVIRNVHCTRITDISWAANGRALMASSTDGYCSITTFGDGELGSPFPMDDFPSLTKDCFPILPPEPKVVPPKKKATKPKAVKTPAVKEVENGKKKGKGETPQKRATNAKSSPSTSAVKSKPKSSPSTSAVKSKPKSSPSTSAVKSKSKSEKSEKKATGSKELASEPVTTPKKKPAPQLTTLDRWFKKTPKPEAKPSTSKESAGTPKAEARVKAPPEIIVIEDDDDDSSPAPEEKVVPRVYPMTPPVRPISTSKRTSSPLVTLKSSAGKGVKRPQEGVSPEELHRLSTAPIKCRRLLDQPVVILRSSDRTGGSVEVSSTSETPSSSQKDQVQESPKVTDPNCPGSPVSSSSSKPPRRIQLITLGKPGPNAGNLE